jgi:ferric iron reductase protein FhuF
MTTSLAATLAAVETTVDYIRASTDAPLDDGWISCATLLDDPARLGLLMAETGTGRDSRDRQVSASLFVQGYAFRIPSVALAAYALGRDRPSVAATTTAFRIARHRPAAVAYLDPEARSTGADELAAEVAEHMGALIDATRAEVQVGERLLWGNVAASFAVAFRAVEGAVAAGDRASVQRRAADFFAAADPWLGGLGRFVTVERETGDQWLWERSNCCLWYRTADDRMCDDCSLLRQDTRTAP